MDIQEYIVSGAIESYVLGLASASEMQEVESLAVQHPEIKHAITSFEEALERQALADAVAPPTFLKQQVMNALAKEGMKLTENNFSTSTVNSTAPPAKMIPITAAPKSVRWLRGAIAATILLLLGSAILNFYFYSQFKKYSAQYNALLVQNGSLVAKNSVIEAGYNMMKDTLVQHVPMKAKPGMGGSAATVLWNKRSKDVYLAVNYLPAQALDKQYQLWALVNGKPVSAGVFDISRDQYGLIRMSNIPNAQAFAITLEKKGGVESPTMEQMYVYGAL